ncbi:MAG: carbohydrate kinase [Spirochaetes bacterium GWB1_59_5]|nr:MAG: carbohydrate kinase [Spirochaetes bacterium GWB1_59_5]
MAQYLLGVDNGGTVIKAALFDLDGSERSVNTEKISLLALQEGYAERNMAELWEANLRAISGLLEKSDIKGREVSAIAVTGHGDGLYPLGENGRILCNAVLSSDRRAEEQVKRWYEDGTFRRVFSKTRQSIWAGQTAPILAWFRDYRPDILRETRSILLCKDYIRYRLTGKIAGEISDMSGSGLLNVENGTYDNALLSDYGLGSVEDKLPQLLQSWQIAGEVTSDVAKATGLHPGTPVIAGLWDIVACSIANGVVDESRLCVVAGTWSINEYISNSPPGDDSVFITARYCLPGYWLTLEGSPTSASNLEWFIDRFLRRRGDGAKAGGGSVYDYCNRLVESVDPESSHLVFVPFLFGSNAGMGTRASFMGLEGWHEQKEVLTAIYEGIAFSHKTHIEKLATYRKLPSTVRLSGGAARSRIWIQIFANVLGLSVEVNNSTETGALGAALCAGVGVGHFDSFGSAVDRMVRISETVHPVNKSVDIYRQKYGDYQAAVHACQTYAAAGKTALIPY